MELMKLQGLDKKKICFSRMSPYYSIFKYYKKNKKNQIKKMLGIINKNAFVTLGQEILF